MTYAAAVDWVERSRAVESVDRWLIESRYPRGMGPYAAAAQARRLAHTEVHPA